MHRNHVAHWAPYDVDVNPLTACGRDIDGPCDHHAGKSQPCRYGVAWTRSRDLGGYGRQPGMPHLQPCRECSKSAAVDVTGTGEAL